MTPHDLLIVLLAAADVTESEPVYTGTDNLIVRRFGPTVWPVLRDGTKGAATAAFRLAYGSGSGSGDVSLYSEVYSCLDPDNCPQIRQRGFLASYELADPVRTSRLFADIRTCIKDYHDNAGYVGDA